MLYEMVHEFLSSLDYHEKNKIIPNNFLQSAKCNILPIQAQRGDKLESPFNLLASIDTHSFFRVGTPFFLLFDF